MQFVPFIQGPRNCLGQNFALLEARIVLALVVKVQQIYCRQQHSWLALPVLNASCALGTDSKILWLQRFSFQTVDDDKITGIQNEYMIPAPPLHGLKVLVK